MAKISTWPAKIIEPIDGAILNWNNGKRYPDGLGIMVRVVAPKGSKVTINGSKAPVAAGRKSEFACEVVLRKQENVVKTRAESNGKISTDSITVLWDMNSTKRYRFSTDDNILFLRDLSVNAHRFRSIFDNEYMSFWRQVHAKYGTKIHFNVYYQTEGFNLSQMPTKYKSEWQENSDWIRLTFHGLKDEPEKPYIKASYEELDRDFKLVTREIERFAGKELLSPFTTIHWGEVTLEGCKALRDNGIKGLVGVFTFDDNGKPSIAYYLDEEKTGYLSGHDYWKDTRTGMFFIKHDLVINNVELNNIASTLDSIASNPNRSEVMEVIIHEQYFVPSLPHYEPDAKERVVATIEWLVRNGYKSVFYEEGFLGS